MRVRELLELLKDEPKEALVLIEDAESFGLRALSIQRLPLKPSRTSKYIESWMEYYGQPVTMITSCPKGVEFTWD